MLTMVSGCDRGARPAQTGKAAPDFKVSDGLTSIHLADYRGKVVLLNFWATWCGPCVAELPSLLQLHRANPDLVVLAVSIDEDPAGIPAFLDETHATFPVVWDEGQVVSQRYTPPTMPTSFVVDKSGIVRFVHAGFRAGDEAELARVVDGLR